MTLYELADALDDVRHLCVDHPEDAKRRIADIHASRVCYELPNRVAYRVWRNIGDGLNLIHDAPAVLEAYLRAAAVDIRAAARMAKENPEEPMTWERAAKILNVCDDEEAP